MPHDPVAEFLAKGRKITRVETGARALADRQIYNAVRGADENALIEQRRIVSRDHLGRDIVCNGLGEFISYA